MSSPPVATFPVHCIFCLPSKSHTHTVLNRCSSAHHCSGLLPLDRESICFLVLILRTRHTRHRSFVCDRHYPLTTTTTVTCLTLHSSGSSSILPLITRQSLRLLESSCQSALITTLCSLPCLCVFARSSSSPLSVYASVCVQRFFQ